MKKVMWLVAAMSFVACGPPSPTAQCKEQSTLECKRSYECFTIDERKSPAFIAVAGSSEGECVSKLNANNCVFAETNPCNDSSKKWDANKASACIEDYRKASCETVRLGTFSSNNCATVCG